MRPARAVLALLLAHAVLLLAAPAQAGGPTSVLLSVPGEGRVAALYYTDPAYEALADLVVVPRSGPKKESGQSHATGQVVTLTWMIHDVTPWRIDRVHLGGPGGSTWVETQEALGDGAIWDQPTVWHRAPAGLAKTLDRLLPAGGTSGGGDAFAPPAPDQPAAAAIEPAAAETSSETAVSPAQVGWGVVVGLGVGAGLTLLWQRQRRRDTAGATDVPATDQLAWP